MTLSALQGPTVDFVEREGYNASMRDDLHRHVNVSRAWRTLIRACAEDQPSSAQVKRLQQAIMDELRPLLDSQAIRAARQFESGAAIFNLDATGVLDYLAREGAAPIEGTIREVLQWGDTRTPNLLPVCTEATNLLVDRFMQQVDSDVGRSEESAIRRCRPEIMRRLRAACDQMPRGWVRRAVQGVLRGAPPDRPRLSRATDRTSIPLGAEGRRLAAETTQVGDIGTRRRMR